MERTTDGKPLKDNLSNYSADKYEKPSLTVDVCICTIRDNALKVLLIQRKNPPFRGYYAIPGGFLEIPKKESLEETAKRELLEETHIEGVYLEQLKTYGDPDRDPRTRVITTAYFALVPWQASLVKAKADDDAMKEEWVDLRKPPKNLAFDHAKILKDLLVRIEGKIQYSSIAFSLLPKKFTWAQLQNVYEIILNKKLITPNFRRKIKTMYEIKELNELVKTKTGRPSKFLKFVKEKAWLKNG